MKTLDVTFVRIYLSEGEGRMPALLERLHDEEKVQGVTVFRGISGFGKSGVLHSSTLLDMSLDLPLVVEIVDVAAKIDELLDWLAGAVTEGLVTVEDVEVAMYRSSEGS